MWWRKPGIPGRWRQEDEEFKAILSYIVAGDQPGLREALSQRNTEGGREKGSGEWTLSYHEEIGL